MILCNDLREDKEKEKLVLEILNWDDSREKVLNLISVPYNSSAIFIEIILKYVFNNKKVLFITNEIEDKIDIIESIKKYTNYRGYVHLRENSNINFSKNSLIVTNYEKAMNLGHQFDLVIYDDLTSLSNYGNYEIMALLTVFNYEGAKIICRSVEPVFQNARCIDIPVKDSKLPFAEPRIITTRIDVNKEIPYVVYEYLNWSIASERKVVIYVPDEEKAENVYNYLLNIKENLHNNILFYKNKENNKLLSNFIKNKRGIIITYHIKDLDLDIIDSDIMVYFADEKVYDYKSLLYICGKVGRNASLGNGEVIFLAKDITSEMETAKNMARTFNKGAWELGLLNL
jgi:Superfamily II DNA/RNA helicase required for DNA uptake (late competence protein)